VFATEIALAQTPDGQPRSRATATSSSPFPAAGLSAAPVLPAAGLSTARQPAARLFPSGLSAPGLSATGLSAAGLSAAGLSATRVSAGSGAAAPSRDGAPAAERLGPTARGARFSDGFPDRHHGAVRQRDRRSRRRSARSLQLAGRVRGGPR